MGCTETPHLTFLEQNPPQPLLLLPPTLCPSVLPLPLTSSQQPCEEVLSTSGLTVGAMEQDCENWLCRILSKLRADKCPDYIRVKPVCALALKGCRDTHPPTQKLGHKHQGKPLGIVLRFTFFLGGGGGGIQIKAVIHHTLTWE